MKITFKSKISEGVRPIEVSSELLNHLNYLMRIRVNEYFTRIKELVEKDPSLAEKTAVVLNKIARDLKVNLLKRPLKFQNVRGEEATLHNFTISVDEGDEEPSGEVDKGRVINTLRLFLPDVPLGDYNDESLELKDSYKHFLELVLKHEARHLTDIYSMEGYADPEEEPHRYLSQNVELRVFMGDFHDMLKDYLEDLDFQDLEKIKNEGLFRHMIRMNFVLDDINLSFKDFLYSISKDKKPYKQSKKVLKPLAILFSQFYHQNSP